MSLCTTVYPILPRVKSPRVLACWEHSVVKATRSWWLWQRAPESSLCFISQMLAMVSPPGSHVVSHCLKRVFHQCYVLLGFFWWEGEGVIIKSSTKSTGAHGLKFVCFMALSSCVGLSRLTAVLKLFPYGILVVTHSVLYTNPAYTAGRACASGVIDPGSVLTLKEEVVTSLLGVQHWGEVGWKSYIDNYNSYTQWTSSSSRLKNC